MNYEQFKACRVGTKVRQGDKIGTICFMDVGSSLDECEVHVSKAGYTGDFYELSDGFSIFPQDFELVEEPVKTVKVKFWIYSDNLGDGSCANRIFNSQEAAEKFASNDDERFCDDINEEELEFDLNGKLITPNPVHYKDRQNT